jgi:hypothetical protein
LLSNLRINKTVSLNTPDGKSLNPMTLLTTLLKMPQLLKLNLNSSLIDPLKEINLLKDSQVLLELPDSKFKKTILLEPIMKNIKMMKMKTSFEQIKLLF